MRSEVCNISDLVLIKIRAGEMDQGLKALVALPKDPDLVPSIHVVAHNHLEHLQHPACTWWKTHVQEKQPNTEDKNNYIK